MIENWIIPCNIKYFDIIQHFKDNKKVIWKNSFSIKKGDNIYIYIGSPYSEIRFRCIVTNDIIDENTLKQNQYVILANKSNNYFSKKEKYIEIEYIYEYPTGFFPFNILKDNGLGQVQIQARTSRKLQPYIDMMEKKLVENELSGGKF